MLKKSQFAASQETSGYVPSKDELSQLFPNLWDFLTQTGWDDGTEREPGSLLVFSDGGVLKAMLKDKDTGRCLWVTAPGIASLLEVADRKVVDPEADWKKDRAMVVKEGKRQRRI